ncbi:MAG: replication initiation factor [Thiobacillus sp.]
MDSQETRNKTQSDDTCRAARAGAADLREELDKDAAPSNTASNNSNCAEIKFVPLRWGVDSLYLSYPGMLAESVTRKLETLKKIAQSEHEGVRATAQYQVEEHIFEVKDKGSGIFPFVLRDNAFRIAFSRPKSGSLPMAYAQVSSSMLAAFAPLQVESRLNAVLEQMGDIEPARTSRIDLFVDFACAVDMESWSRHAWVTRAHNIQAYSCQGQFSGWSIGLGGVMAGRLYNKTLEIETSGKEYMKELWLQAGWDGVTPIWRLEFELKRELLTQKGVSGLHQTLDHLGGLWAYATDEWLRLTLPSDQDSTRSRWPVHPLWACLASVDWGKNGGPLLDRFTSVSAPSEKQTLSRLLSSITTLMALDGQVGLNEAWDGLRLRLDNHLHTLCMWEGIHPDQYVEEKVRIKARRFNSILNQQDDEDPAPVEQARLYRKLSRGG